MPLRHDLDLDQGRILIWEATESPEWMRLQLPPAVEVPAALAHKPPRRQLEWLTSRYLLQQLAPGDMCLKAATGKPYLDSRSRSISISHSRQYVAVVAHEAEVGLDIQVETPQVERVAQKFVNASEWAWVRTAAASQHRYLLHVIWGAKEAMFKAYGLGSVDFRAHLTVEALYWTPDGGTTRASLHKPHVRIDYRVSYRWVSGCVLVMVSEAAPFGE